MTADYSFLSYYPYWGFQGLTSHYANPLAQFDLRAAQIQKWSTLKTAEDFIHALDTSPWPPPTVFLMRRGANGAYALRLAEDVYPNQPNVRRYKTPSICGPPCSTTRGSLSNPSARSCWPSAGRGPNR